MAAELNAVEEETSEVESYSNLPSFEIAKPSELLHFDGFSGESAVTAWKKVYDEIVRWRRNIFLLPSGQAGKSFLEEMTRLAKAWASKSKEEAVAMIMLMVMPALLLQKPSKR